MMNKVFLLFATFFINSFMFAQCSDSNKYPIEIQKLGLHSQYDLSKWFLYCIFSDREIDFVKYSEGRYVLDESKPKVTYGEADLCFENVRVKKDTLELEFYFYYKGQKITPDLVDTYPYAGTVFTTSHDSISHYLLFGDADYFWTKCDNYAFCGAREVKPLQPEVIGYIKTNQRKLNSWFRKEAINRGVLQ